MITPLCIDIIQKSKGETEIPVAAASVLAKALFEERVNKLNERFNVSLRVSNPSEIDPDILPFVAKIHFKNVEKFLKL